MGTMSKPRSRSVVMDTTELDLFETLRRKGAKQFATNREEDDSNHSGACYFGKLRNDTFVIYTAPNEKFGRRIKFDDMIYDVPKEYMQLINTALVLSYSKIELLKKDKDILIKGSVIKVVSEFPTNCGWYKTDLETGIPNGVKVESSDSEARYLQRHTGQYIGTVAREPFITGWRTIYLNQGPKLRLGVSLISEPT